MAVEHENQDVFRPSRQLYCIFVIIGLLNLAAALDGSSISTALPNITADLGGTAVEAFWAGTSFLITSAVFQPIFSLASDILGRRDAVLAAVVLFTIGSIMAGLAQSFPLLLAGRCIQGTGGGGIMALTEVLIADLIPLRERGKWFSVRSGTWALGSVLGPIIGGSFAESDWRWIFWLNLPFCGLGLALIPIFLRLERGAQRLQFRTIDYTGILLCTGSFSAFLIPLSWGGIMYPWDSWRTLVPLLLGVVGLVVFAVYETYIPAKPLIHPAIFANRSITLNYLTCFLQGLTLFTIVYYVPLYFQGCRGFSPLMAGVGELPVSLTVPPLSVITGFIIARVGHYRWSIWTGWTIGVLGLGLYSLLDVHTSTVAWIFLLAVPGIGLGMLFAGPMLAIQASANIEYLSMSVTLTAFIRTVGQAVGVAIGGVVFQNRIQAELEKSPLLAGRASEFAREAAGLVGYIQSLPAGEEKEVIQQAYADALAVVWYVMCALAGLGLVSSLFTQSYSLHQELESQQGLRRRSGDDIEAKKSSEYSVTEGKSSVSV